MAACFGGSTPLGNSYINNLKTQGFMDKSHTLRLDQEAEFRLHARCCGMPVIDELQGRIIGSKPCLRSIQLRKWHGRPLLVCHRHGSVAWDRTIMEG
jgi:hypothetical protein